MNAPQFIAKWQKVELKERSAAQEHFLDLCRVVEHPTPAKADPVGEWFCFEKGAAKQGGGDGFADVWKKDFFGWEYKGKHKDLDEAYNQLLLYRNTLASPPLLVVCDLDRIIVHTNFEKTVSVAHEISLEYLGEPRSLEILRAVFFDPEKLRPGSTSETITQNAARHIAGIAESIRQRGVDSAQVAHFLDRVVFCLFAEDVGLLPDLIFTRIMEKSAGDPTKFRRFLGQLFEAMGRGGEFGLESIRHFNGNLFDDASVPELTAEQIKEIVSTTKMDWGAIDPSIFGTLFERGLDPSKRSQLGAHFTSKEDIELLVDAVVMQPLRREWAEVRKIVENLLTTGKKKSSISPTKPLTTKAKRKARGEADSSIHQFLVRLQNVKVLDPACGSGNFLYVTLQKLKDLEKEVILFSMGKGLISFLPLVGPWQLYGIEINPYAHDLAQMTVWIGWLQWNQLNGFGSPQDPILRPMAENFQCRDAILDLTDPAVPNEPDWPQVDFIVGNPPFLGGKMLRRELGDTYMEQLFALWKDRVPHEADLCCYWFEKARTQIESGKCTRAGLLATQGIRGGANREVLKRIKETGDIFWAISDKDWILDGANVHVSLVAFDSGIERSKELDGFKIENINSNLTSTADITTARYLNENAMICFQGPVKVGKFDINDEFAILQLLEPNPHGKPNSDILLPWLNGKDITAKSRNGWIIDFGELSLTEAAYYESLFQYVNETIRPARMINKDRQRRENWWRLGRSGTDWKRAITGLPRTIFTPRVSKHRIFVWAVGTTLPDSAVVGFARSDDFFFGVLHSRLHEVWARSQGTQVRERESGFRYTPTTCFETFPFPTSTPEQEAAIAGAARELNELRERWLNPPEWTREEVLEFPGTVGGPWDRYIDQTTVDGKSNIGLVRYPRLVSKDEASAVQLQKRTLTNLYNARPTWLALAHQKLDAAVFDAYGWNPDMSDAEILAKLLELNLATAGKN